MRYEYTQKAYIRVGPHPSLLGGATCSTLLARLPNYGHKRSTTANTLEETETGATLGRVEKQVTRESVTLEFCKQLVRYVPMALGAADRDLRGQ